MFTCVEIFHAEQADEHHYASQSQGNQFVTDQIMPHGTGMELAQDLLELKPDLPILLTTASADLISDERAGQNGIRAVFGKPINSKLRRRRINRLLHETT
jgi:CheY-like chemotaxis protein